MPSINLIIIISLVSTSLLFKSVKLQCSTLDSNVTEVTLDGNFTIGGLFPITTINGPNIKFNQIRGVERMEAMIRAIDLINSNSSMLPNISLGYIMRDTKGREADGIEQTIDLILSDIVTTSSVNKTTPIGIVGASSSSVSVPVAGLLRVFQISQISYASTSALLSNRDLYDYFYRTVGSDNFQATAMLDIIKKYDWRFVNIVYTSSTYGSPGREAFEEQIRNNEEFCTDQTFSLDRLTDINNVAVRLINSTANVVVCFCTDEDASRVLRKVNNLLQERTEPRDHIIWLASDAWATAETTVEGIESFAHGYFGITPLSSIVEDFRKYFEFLNPYNLTHDPWFCGYFKERFNCSYESGPNMCLTSINEEEPMFMQNSFIAFVYDATYAFAYALEKVLEDNCSIPYSVIDQKCLSKETNEYISLGGDLLRQALQKVSFISPMTNNLVKFDSMGNGISRYSVLNYQKSGESGDTYDAVSVGIWNEGLDDNRLSITSPVQFGPNANQTSYCRRTPRCEPGAKTIFTESRCCWTCELCQANTFSNETLSTSCTTCPDRQWGVNPMGPNTECQPIEIIEVNFDSIICYILLGVAFLGFWGYAVVCIIYFVKWNCLVVKASGREHCILILIGAGISFPLTLFACAKPTYPTCIIYSLLFWFSFSMLIFPLLMKIVKIVRIFVVSKKNHDVKFLTWPWQITFSIIPVILVECIVIIGYSSRPEVVTEEVTEAANPLPPIIERKCTQMHFILNILLYVIFALSSLMLLLFAIITRNYPKNFRESVHIMYASIGLCAIILAGGILYFILQSNGLGIYVNFVNNLILLIITGIILTSFFGPRIFFIVTGKEEETGTMTTLDGKNLKDYTAHQMQKQTMQKINKGVLDPFANFVRRKTETKNPEDINTSDENTVTVKIAKDTDKLEN